MAITPVNSTLTVTTAGTRVQATADTDIKPSSVYFEALSTNAGAVFIGLVAVSSTAYIARLTAGVGFTIEVDMVGPNYRSGGQGLQLSAIYVDAATSGDKIQMTYLYPTGG